MRFTIVRAGLVPILAACVLGQVMLACRDRVPSAPILPALDGGAATAHSANLDGGPTATTFAWLPPLGTGAADPATFDPNAAPQIQICLWVNNLCSGPLVAQFSTTPSGTVGPIAVNSAAGDYEASWNLLNSAFTTRKTYRIRILQGTNELGSISVDVVRGRWAPTRSDGTLAPLIAANSLPISFGLSVTAVSAILSPMGGTVALNGFARATFPAGALQAAASIALSVQPLTADLVEQYKVGATTNPTGPSADDAVSLTTGTQPPNSGITIELNVPAKIPSTGGVTQPGLYAKVLQSDGLDYFILVNSTYDAQSGTIKGTLDPWAFTSARRSDGIFEAIVLAGTAPARTSNSNASPSRHHTVVRKGLDERLSSGTASSGCGASEIGQPLADMFETSPYGWRPSTGWHDGIDLRARVPTVVHAVASGTVQVFIQTRPPAVGNYFIKLWHDQPAGAFTMYMHLTPGSAAAIDGKHITAGTGIGLTGSSGTSDPHLHFEYHGPDGLSVDPAPCFAGLDLEPDDPDPPPPSTPTPTPVPPPNSGGNSGTSWGDPHIITPDGLRYDFQAKGDFVFAKSTTPGDDFEVHIRYVPGPAQGITATDAVAARVVGDVVAVYPNGSTFDVVINGILTSATTTLTQQLQGGGTVRVTTGAATVSWPDRSVLTINQGTGYNRGATLLLSPARLGKVQGLLGNYDGIATNDLRLPNGLAPQEIYQDFRTAWRVPLGSAGALFQRGPDPWDFAPPAPPALSSFPASAVTAARQMCVTAGVSSPAIVETCALDVVATGDNSIAAASVKADPATIGVLVSPSLSYLVPGATQTFAAAVSGLGNQAVSWSTSGGSITVTGSNTAIYTAPATPGAYTLTARSVQNGAAVSSATVNVALGCIAPPAGVVHWWPGDGNSRDIVGNADGVLVGGAGFAPGVVSQSLKFNGVDGYMRLGSVFPATSGTVEFWLNRVGPSATNGLEVYFGSVDWQFGIPNRAPTLYSGGGQGSPGLIWEIGNRATVGTQALLPFNTWRHIAMTWQRGADNSISSITYVDGAPVGSTTTSVPYEGFAPPYVAAYNSVGSPPGDFANAMIDELTLYNRPLSQIEIQAVHDAGARGKCQPAAPTANPLRARKPPPSTR